MSQVVDIAVLLLLWVFVLCAVVDVSPQRTGRTAAAGYGSEPGAS